MLKQKLTLLVGAGLLLGILVFGGCNSGSDKDQAGQTGSGADKVSIRVGYFPNITHSQALVGLADGTFQKALGPDVTIDKKLFNAGPSEMEALLAGEIDLGYIGPGPAINGFAKSQGRLQVIAGATNAGAVLVVREDAGINTVKDLADKRIAVPQFGNTQDISLRKVLQDAGLKDAAKGGNVTVLQVENPDILTAFARKELDAALVPEPWGARLVKQAGGKILLDWNQVWRQGDYATAVVIARTDFLKQHPDLAEKWLKAHVELTERISKDPRGSKTIINARLKELTQKELSPDIMDSSFARLTVTFDPTSDSVREFAALAVNNGYLRETPNVDGLINLDFLNRALKQKGLPEIRS